MCGYRLINDHFPQFWSDYRVFERPDPRASPDSDRSLVPGGVGPHSSGARPGLGPPGEARGRPEAPPPGASVRLTSPKVASTAIGGHES